MVLNDVTNEFSTLIDLLKKNTANDTFIKSALSISTYYQDKLSKLVEIFLKSPKKR